MENIALRSALGLESSKWDLAGEFAIPLRQIDMLAYMSDKDRTLRWVAKQLYSMLFRSLGESMVDNKRRCAWYFGSDVRLVSLLSDAFAASTDLMAASGPQPSDPVQF